MAGRAWTVPEQREALAWRRSGVATTEIASRLGRSPAAVKHYLVGAAAGYGDGEPGRPWSPEDEAAVVRLRRAGHGRQYIADQTGRTRPAITHLLKRLDITYRCALCGHQKPAEAMAWSRRPGIPSCRECAPGRRTQRRTRAPVPEPPISLADDREGRIQQLASQFQQSNHLHRTPGQPRQKIGAGTYVLPTEAEWRERFTTHPETLARVIRDLILQPWFADHPTAKTGRRPNVRLTAADLITYLPPAFAHSLLPSHALR